MTDERLDERIREVAGEYRDPPATPRDEIWNRIEAARRSRAPARTDVVNLANRRRIWFRTTLALAAVLALGVAIGRWMVPELRSGATGAPAATVATRERPAQEARGETVVRYYALNHLRRVDYLLTDYQTGHVTEEFRASSRDLLAETRQLLDSPRLTDPQIRRLLEDLEMLLAQIAQLAPNGPGGERALIDDNMAERAIRPRLRNAIPAGPAA